MSVSATTRSVGDVTVVDVSGRITLGEGSSALREALRNMIARGGRKVLLNLAEVSYIDSSGIRELVTAYTSLTNAGGALKLMRPNKRVNDILQITRLDTIFEIHDEETQAVRSFA
jgi:anti-sigma B factor antagonist